MREKARKGVREREEGSVNLSSARWAGGGGMLSPAPAAMRTCVADKIARAAALKEGACRLLRSNMAHRIGCRAWLALDALML